MAPTKWIVINADTELNLQQLYQSLLQYAVLPFASCHACYLKLWDSYYSDRQ